MYKLKPTANHGYRVFGYYEVTDTLLKVLSKLKLLSHRTNSSVSGGKIDNMVTKFMFKP